LSCASAPPGPEIRVPANLVDPLYDPSPAVLLLNTGGRGKAHRYMKAEG